MPLTAHRATDHLPPRHATPRCSAAPRTTCLHAAPLLRRPQCPTASCGRGTCRSRRTRPRPASLTRTVTTSRCSMSSTPTSRTVRGRRSRRFHTLEAASEYPTLLNIFHACLACIASRTGRPPLSIRVESLACCSCCLIIAQGYVCEHGVWSGCRNMPNGCSSFDGRLFMFMPSHAWALSCH